MKRIRLTALCVVALLAGCARSVPAPQHSLSIEIPENWSGGALVSSPAPGSNWWTYFDEPDLDRAIAEALEGSHDLRAAAARIETALADARIAGAALEPDLSLALSRNQQRQNFIGFPIPGSESNVLSSTSTSYGLRLTSSWEPDLWGRILAGEDAAVTDTRVRYAELAGARLSLTGQVAKAWFGAVEAERQVALAEVSLASYRVSAERVRARFQSGLRPSLDLRLALTEAAAAEATLEQRRELRDGAQRGLEALLGRYPSGDYELASDLPDLTQAVPGGLPSELLHRRPDLLAAELQIRAADARTEQAQADLRPRFSLTTGTGTSSGDLLGLVDHNLFVWNFLGNLVQPLINGGRLRATVDRNRSTVEALLAGYESRILEAYREVESTLAAEHALGRREQALEEASRQAVAAQALAEGRYRLGLTDIITVLSAQRTAYNSETQLLTARRLRLDNRVDLHLALGGGFDPTDIPLPAEIMAATDVPGEIN